MAEWWNNSSPHIALKMSPFEALYGYPPSFPFQTPDGLVVDVVEWSFHDKQQLSHLLKENLQLA